MSDASGFHGDPSAGPADTSRALSAEQRAIVDCWGRGVAIVAGAGCGKSTTLVAKCEAFVARNPEGRFAAVTFTEKSAGDLRGKLLAAPSIAPRLLSPGGHWVATIHGLSGAIAREYPREAGIVGDESVLSEPEARALWEEATRALWKDDLPERLAPSFDRLLEREGHAELLKLLARLRDIEPLGALEALRRDVAAGSDHGALIAVGTYLLDRYSRAKEKRGSLDFADLEKAADRALESPRVRESLASRFDLLLVDEFQDTNPLQARILERVARQDLANIVIVGDPKQSVYRFRDADVRVLERFASRIGDPFLLTGNYRSRPEIIRFVNEVCEPVFVGSGMAYDPLAATRAPGGGIERIEDATPERLADWLSAEIAAGRSPGEHALLLRRIRGGERWIRALVARGIPVAVGSGGFLWEDPRARELAALLNWRRNPLNRRSAAVFLRAPWRTVGRAGVGQPASLVSLDPAAIDREADIWMRSPDPWDEFLAGGGPIAEACATHARPGEILSRLLEIPELERELGAQALALWHRCEELSRGGRTGSAVVAELLEACEEKRREKEVPPPSGLGAVCVMSIHASKGLEFPCVILADFGGKRRASKRPILYWNPSRGAFLAGRDADGERLKNDESENDWWEEEKRQELAESKRLFYVALTRARERLVLAIEAPKGESDERAPPSRKARRSKGAEPGEAVRQPEPPESPEAIDDWRAWVGASAASCTLARVPRAERAGRIANPAPRSPVAAKPAPSLKRRRHSVTEWNLLAASEEEYLRRIRGTEGDSPSLDSLPPARGRTGLDPRELGTRLHELIEARDWAQGWKGTLALEQDSGGLFKAETLRDWRARNPETAARAFSELAFEIPVAGEVLVGAMDSVEVGESGEWLLSDYKFTLGEKDPALLTSQYRTQLELYAYALGVLEPRARDRIRSRIFHFWGAGWREIPIELSAPVELERIAVSLATRAAHLLREVTGV